MANHSHELYSENNPEILCEISNWNNFFQGHAETLRKRSAIRAQGGTLDSRGKKLSPIEHPVNIESTESLTSVEIAKLFDTHQRFADTLGELYPWSQLHLGKIPWQEVSLGSSVRISSFDSGQEEEPHFLASVLHHQRILKDFDFLINSQGTDSLVEKSTLFAILFSSKLLSSNKKITFLGSPESGFKPDSVAIPNISAGIYVGLEKALPGGVYIVSSRKSKGQIETQILPALGSVKLHAKGFFYAPNSGPLVSITDGSVFLHPLYHEIKKRLPYFSWLPDLTQIYLRDEEGVLRLERALQNTVIETVKNSPKILDKWYEEGHRAFVLMAKGEGNAPPKWKRKIKEIIDKGDTTVMIITLADSGDINLKAYEAGLDVEGVMSGRTLREDAAWILAGILHDLKMHNQLPMDVQKLVELYCFLSGMINLSTEELNSLSRFTGTNDSISHLIYPTPY